MKPLGLSCELEIKLAFKLQLGLIQCLRHFAAGNSKEIYQPLGLVSVQYRNKALIKTYGG